MYKETEDNELLYLAEENNEDAFTVLIDRYAPKIHALISKYKTKALQVGLDISDLYQEGLIGLINAIKTYNKDREASFKTYVVVLIERQMLDLIKSNNRNKDKSLNNAISLDNFTYEETQSLYNIVEIDNFTPELRLINEELTEEVKTVLTEFELKVYELKLDGKTNREISAILDKSTRSIENTIQRIKLKIKEKMKI